METKNIDISITIEPNYLGGNLKDNMLKKISKDLKDNLCSQEHGYIIEVNKITKIKDNTISNASAQIIFDVCVEIQALKPEIDKIFEGEVCMIFSGGIFLCVLDKLKILVPATLLSKYKLDPKTNIYKNRIDDNVTIKKGDVLKVKIVGTKYSKKNFSSFGSIVEEE